MNYPDAEDTNSPAGPGVTDNGTSTHQQPLDHDATGATQQPLCDWARDHHLTSDTVEVLKNNGCETVLVVTSLTESDVREMTLNIRQRRMLLCAIAISQDRATLSAGMGPLPGTSTAPAPTATPRGPPIPGDATTQPTAPPGVSGETHTTTQPPLLPSGGNLLADLLGQGRQNGGAQAGSTTTTPAATDPEIYLHLAAQKGEVDYNDITDFVPGDSGGTAHAESVLGTSSDIARPSMGGGQFHNHGEINTGWFARDGWDKSVPQLHVQSGGSGASLLMAECAVLWQGILQITGSPQLLLGYWHIPSEKYHIDTETCC